MKKEQVFAKFSEFNRNYSTDMFSDSSYSEPWFSRSLEKKHKKRKCSSCECKRNESCHECSFMSSCSEFSGSAVASTLPRYRHDKHLDCIRNVSHLVSSGDDRHAFKNFMHKGNCRPGKCQEDCKLSWLSKISSSSCSSSSSSSYCGDSKMSESDSKQLEMIFIQFLKFLQESSNETYASKSVDEKIVDVYFGKTEKGDDVIKVTGKRDGKAVTKDRATLTFSVGELVCFKVQQDAKGKHRFCLTSSPLAGPTSSPLPGSPLPITSGKMLYQITSRTPKTFYYGCSDKEGMGGKIVIKN